MNRKFQKFIAFQTFIPYGFLFMDVSHTLQVVGLVVQLIGLATMIAFNPFFRRD